jgi:hypothetical protein
MLRDKPSGEREWKSAKVLRPLAQGALTRIHAQVPAGLLGWRLWNHCARRKAQLTGSSTATGVCS